MEYRLVHNCIKVRDLARSLDFYARALYLHEKRRVQCGPVTLVYLGDEAGSEHELELNYRPGADGGHESGAGSAAAFGDTGNAGSTHFAFVADDYASALAEHRAMGCVLLENEANNIYFIKDPDGYIIEIMPKGHFSMTERGKFDED